MRIHDLYESESEENNTHIPGGIRHTLPQTLVFPDMASNFEYYRFVVGMASHPEVDDKFYEPVLLRDIPMAVAYTKEEYDMIKAVAKRLGHKTEEISFGGSKEIPGIHTASPVMPFKMTEAQDDIARALLECAEADI